MNLTIKNLSAQINGKAILNKVSLELKAGKIIALMGPNGSGKSTLAQVLMGHPAYTVPDGNGKSSPSVRLGKTELLDLSSDKRAKLGLFLGFQNPVSVPGVNVANLLRTVKGDAGGRKKGLHNPGFDAVSFHENLYKETQKMKIAPELLRRSLNEDFSGGEKKKLEMLQSIMLSPKFAVLDEIDTGLDVDALKIVANGISVLKSRGCGILIITHYLRILKYVHPDEVYILVKGQIKQKGGYKLASEIEKNGYSKWLKAN